MDIPSGWANRNSLRRNLESVGSDDEGEKRRNLDNEMLSQQNGLYDTNYKDGSGDEMDEQKPGGGQAVDDRRARGREKRNERRARKERTQGGS